MKVVWKYELRVTEAQDVEMPEGAELLAADSQDDRPDVVQVWARVDPTADEVKRRIVMTGTGHPMKRDDVPYVGTVLAANGRLVWHVFDGGEQ